MRPRYMVTATTALLCCILGMLSLTSGVQAAMGNACCTSYTRTPVAFHLIKGFKEQSYREICRIDAIIFYTRRNKKVCASSKDEWVRRALARLSSKLKKMSVARPSAAETLKISNGTGAGVFSNSSSGSNM
ncbi:C-C motif chemokine 20-like [Lampris incognitus]|uniref:C-C motif chemokine 20-like n=1 Tax=Lampris incognitus TaxID=2546036 RepID=UPI0024B58D42|nr:C-C motif chemokine 20-like [Lampris incognitus]